MSEHYKTMSDEGNILFYQWNRAGSPQNTTDLKRYGRYLATFFPQLNKWYKIKINRPERFKKIITCCNEQYILDGYCAACGAKI